VLRKTQAFEAGFDCLKDIFLLRAHGMHASRGMGMVIGQADIIFANHADTSQIAVFSL
jgi:hypothetical protein